MYHDCNLMKKSDWEEYSSATMIRRRSLKNDKKGKKESQRKTAEKDKDIHLNVIGVPTTNVNVNKTPQGQREEDYHLYKISIDTTKRERERKHRVGPVSTLPPQPKDQPKRSTPGRFVNRTPSSESDEDDSLSRPRTVPVSGNKLPSYPESSKPPNVESNPDICFTVPGEDNRKIRIVGDPKQPREVTSSEIQARINKSRAPPPKQVGFAPLDAVYGTDSSAESDDRFPFKKKSPQVYQVQDSNQPDSFFRDPLKINVLPDWPSLGNDNENINRGFPPSEQNVQPKTEQDNSQMLMQKPFKQYVPKDSSLMIQNQTPQMFKYATDESPENTRSATPITEDKPRDSTLETPSSLHPRSLKSSKNKPSITSPDLPDTYILSSSPLFENTGPNTSLRDRTSPKDSHSSIQKLASGQYIPVRTSRTDERRELAPTVPVGSDRIPLNTQNLTPNISKLERPSVKLSTNLLDPQEQYMTSKPSEAQEVYPSLNQYSPQKPLQLESHPIDIVATPESSPFKEDIPMSEHSTPSRGNEVYPINKQYISTKPSSGQQNKPLSQQKIPSKTSQDNNLQDLPRMQDTLIQTSHQTMSGYEPSMTDSTEQLSNLGVAPDFQKLLVTKPEPKDNNSADFQRTKEMPIQTSRQTRSGYEPTLTDPKERISKLGVTPDIQRPLNKKPKSGVSANISTDTSDLPNLYEYTDVPSFVKPPTEKSTTSAKSYKSSDSRAQQNVTLPQQDRNNSFVPNELPRQMSKPGVVYISPDNSNRLYPIAMSPEVDRSPKKLSSQSRQKDIIPDVSDQSRSYKRPSMADKEIMTEKGIGPSKGLITKISSKSSKQHPSPQKKSSKESSKQNTPNTDSVETKPICSIVSSIPKPSFIRNKPSTSDGKRDIGIGARSNISQPLEKSVILSNKTTLRGTTDSKDSKTDKKLDSSHTPLKDSDLNPQQVIYPATMETSHIVAPEQMSNITNAKPERETGNRIPVETSKLSKYVFQPQKMSYLPDDEGKSYPVWSTSRDQKQSKPSGNSIKADSTYGPSKRQLSTVTSGTHDRNPIQESNPSTSIGQTKKYLPLGSSNAPSLEISHRTYGELPSSEKVNQKAPEARHGTSSTDDQALPSYYDGLGSFLDKLESKNKTKEESEPRKSIAMPELQSIKENKTTDQIEQPQFTQKSRSSGKSMQLHEVTSSELEKRIAMSRAPPPKQGRPFFSGLQVGSPRPDVNLQKTRSTKSPIPVIENIEEEETADEMETPNNQYASLSQPSVRDRLYKTTSGKQPLIETIQEEETADEVDQQPYIQPERFSHSKRENMSAGPSKIYDKDFKNKPYAVYSYNSVPNKTLVDVTSENGEKAKVKSSSKAPNYSFGGGNQYFEQPNILAYPGQLDDKTPFAYDHHTGDPYVENGEGLALNYAPYSGESMVNGKNLPDIHKNISNSSLPSSDQYMVKSGTFQRPTQQLGMPVDYQGPLGNFSLEEINYVPNSAQRSNNISSKNSLTEQAQEPQFESKKYSPRNERNREQWSKHQFESGTLQQPLQQPEMLYDNQGIPDEQPLEETNDPKRTWQSNIISSNEGGVKQIQEPQSESKEYSPGSERKRSRRSNIISSSEGQVGEIPETQSKDMEYSPRSKHKRSRQSNIISSSEGQVDEIQEPQLKDMEYSPRSKHKRSRRSNIISSSEGQVDEIQEPRLESKDHSSRKKRKKTHRDSTQRETRQKYKDSISTPRQKSILVQSVSGSDEVGIFGRGPQEEIVYVGRIPNTTYNVFFSPETTNARSSETFKEQEPKSQKPKHPKKVSPIKSSSLMTKGPKGIIIFVNKKNDLDKDPFSGKNDSVDGGFTSSDPTGEKGTPSSKHSQGELKRISTKTSRPSESLLRKKSDLRSSGKPLSREYSTQSAGETTEAGGDTAVSVEKSPSGNKITQKYPCGCIRIINRDPEHELTSEEIVSAFCRDGSKCKVSHPELQKKNRVISTGYVSTDRGGFPEIEVIADGIVSRKTIPHKAPSPTMRGANFTGSLNIKSNKFNGVCNFYFDPRLKHYLRNNMDEFKAFLEDDDRKYSKQ